MIAWSYGGGAAQRFWSRVLRLGPDECWPWRLRLNGKGYGRFTVDFKTMMAHVASYLIVVGPIPDGLCVLHRCDNPRCVNPAHLFLGTRADNNADMRTKGRGVNPPIGINSGTWTSEKVRGRKHPRARLSQGDLDRLLVLAAAGASTRDLARTFGLTIRHVNKLRHDAGVTSGGRQ